MCTTNCSGALVLFTVKEINIDSVLEAVYGLLLPLKTLRTLNCWALPPNVIVQYQYLQKHTVHATELHWCWFVNEFDLFYSSEGVGFDFIFLFAVLLNIRLLVTVDG